MFRSRGEGRGSHSAEALRLVSVTKVYGSDATGTGVTALDSVSLSLPTGGFTAVMGPSGSGKSTLLTCAAGLDRPTGGLVVVDGCELTGDEAAATRLRRERIGFVFQACDLLPTLTVLENVALPVRLAGRRVDAARAVDILRRVGLGARLDHLPSELSGGQRQRVAVARALVTEPALILADEPTGALDTRSARDVLGLLRRAVDEYGRTVVMVTHDPVAASFADEVLFLADGRLVDRLPAPTPGAVAERLARLPERSPEPVAA
ncbi:ABC transporter ATP-binding protein [Streptomyces sp. PT12]|uniref:ABC transporter ATP-binding protein n=1 Tax=Streptomyces sp. PT12 TaxID=1510197 RepID=UPI000DE2ABE2|nr:ABC transporter ATP-binding protein [Streptomyces sp. PT12]RBM11821.1 ABC transporter [Streptomyces sp. PT12]